MKNCIFLLLTATILMTACKTETAKNDSKSPHYSETEKLEIAALIANSENNFNQMLEFSEGKAVIYRNDSIGFIDPKGHLMMLPEIKEMQSFKGGLAAAKTRDDVACYVDATGKIVQKFPNYIAVYSFDDGDLTVFFHKNDKFGLLDKSFKEVIPAIYNQTSFWKDGLLIGEKGGKWGAVDKDNKTVIPFEFESMGALDEAGYIQVSKKTGNGFIDKTGKEVVPCTFYNMFPFYENLAHYLNKQEDGKYGVINRKGEIVVQPQNDAIEHFSNGMAVVSKIAGETSKLGYIDNTGKEVIPTQYESARDFTKEGYALVGNNGNLFFIDKKGQKAAFPHLDELKNYSLTEFNNGFAKVTLEDGSNVFLDRLGNILKPSDLLNLRSQ